MSNTRLQNPFNANQIPPDQGSGFRFLPLGEYPFRITGGEVKANFANDGGLVQFDGEVLQGEHAGQQASFSIRLYDKDEKTKNMAEGQMSAISHATGVFLFEDLSALFNTVIGLRAYEAKLTTEQQARKDRGENVKPFINFRILNADGSEIKGQPSQGGGQQFNQQQPQQQANNGNGGGWGGQQGNQQQQPNNPPPPPPPAPSQAPAAGGWGNNANNSNSNNANTGNTGGGNGGGGWSQNNSGGGGTPAWGKR